MVRSKFSYPVMRKGGIWQLIGMTEELVIIFSTASESEAPPLAQALVMQHLAACVNILPVTSVYRWQGDLCRDHEHLLIIKTVQKNVETVIREIRKLHSYELPEMVVIPVTGGYLPYLEWVAAETRT